MILLIVWSYSDHCCTWILVPELFRHIWVESMEVSYKYIRVIWSHVRSSELSSTYFIVISIDAMEIVGSIIIDSLIVSELFKEDIADTIAHILEIQFSNNWNRICSYLNSKFVFGWIRSRQIFNTNIVSIDWHSFNIWCIIWNVISVLINDGRSLYIGELYIDIYIYIFIYMYVYIYIYHYWTISHGMRWMNSW